MRTNTSKQLAILLVLGTSLVWGCTAEVEGDGGGDESNLTNQPEACWADFGPDAPGECVIGEERECFDYDPSTGQDFCREKCVNIDGKAVWGLKTNDFQCPFYDTSYHIGTSDQCLCNTPLVLSFDNTHVVFTDAAGSAFDLTRAGMCHTGDWPTSATPWLAFDRNGDGVIGDGGELFGSATKLQNGSFATNGFEALRDLDTNHDGVFEAQDPAFSKVVVWTDANLNRESEKNELTSLGDYGVTAIDLRDHREWHCDARGNCEGERSRFSFVDSSGKTNQGTVIDVYLPTR
jgi:hypothetical protein